MKRILLFCVVLFGTVQMAFSQQVPMDEVVYLKNGSIIRGIIVEQVPNESLKIQTADGSLFVFEMDQVQKITKEPQVRNSRALRQPEVEEPANKNGRRMGMVQFFGLGYQASFYDSYSYEGVAFFSSHFVYGYQFRNRFFVGGGLGVEHLAGDVLADSYNLRIPVFAVAKINLNKKRVSPFFQFDGGYHFNSDEWVEDGFFFLPKFGLDFNLGDSKRKALFLSLSLCELGQLTSYHYNYSNDYYYRYSYDGYEVYAKVGLNFGLRF